MLNLSVLSCPLFVFRAINNKNNYPPSPCLTFLACSIFMEIVVFVNRLALHRRKNDNSWWKIQALIIFHRSSSILRTIELFLCRHATFWAACWSDSSEWEPRERRMQYNENIFNYRYNWTFVWLESKLILINPFLMSKPCQLVLVNFL